MSVHKPCQLREPSTRRTYNATVFGHGRLRSPHTISELPELYRDSVPLAQPMLTAGTLHSLQLRRYSLQTWLPHNNLRTPRALPSDTISLGRTRLRWLPLMSSLTYLSQPC